MRSCARTDRVRSSLNPPRQIPRELGVNARVTADGKAYGYSFCRELSDLFLVDGVR